MVCQPCLVNLKLFSLTLLPPILPVLSELLVLSIDLFLKDDLQFLSLNEDPLSLSFESLWPLVMLLS